MPQASATFLALSVRAFATSSENVKVRSPAATSPAESFAVDATTLPVVVVVVGELLIVVVTVSEKYFVCPSMYFSEASLVTDQ